MFLLKICLPTCFLVATTVGLAAKDWTSLKIGIEANYPPWTSLNKNGSPEGFDVEFSNQVCTRTKITCTFVKLSFDDLIPSLVTGHVDVVLSGLEVTQRRDKIISFSRTYARDEYVFIVTNGSPLGNLDGAGKRVNLVDGGAKPIIQGWQAKLSGKKLATQTSTRAVEFAHKFLQETSVLEVPTPADVLQSVAAKTADIAMLTERAAIETLRTPAFSTMRIVGATATGDVLGEGVAAGIRKSDADLKQIFDQEISKATADGTLLSMSMKWFGADLRPK
ncbi:transporter substrate-binding domain-containing protein [Bradyrhizobium sp. RP6]|uniref:substrate-binding periplasmic protein n=1 Tax=Bradyrhizobium sp. RP6 TaxID=2489596 RepID=UPI0013157C1A|nr:transporter substrate-binding domain-containing protein [Bradyrhizobium sp. RP6]